MLFFRHLWQLLRDIWGFARQHKAWWIIPIVVVLLLLAGFVVVCQTVAPYIYTLF
jgi:hypothetical protein